MGTPDNRNRHLTKGNLMVIWKWKLGVVDLQTLELPAGSGLLTVQAQDDVPQLWTLCDDSTELKEKRQIAIYGTGNPMPNEPGEYIATFQLGGGKWVFHAFEVDQN